MIEQHDERSLRVHGSLFGLAMGDALGAEIEFMQLEEIKARFPDGFDDLPIHQGMRGAITDDTQMTLFTAEGILQARERHFERGISDVRGMVHRALIRWLLTQGEHPSSTLPIEMEGLVSDPRLHVRRAPGLTCLSALRESSTYGALANNDSKGCGTIMRVAPIAWFVNRTEVRATAIETSALTHGHPTGQLAAAAWAELLADTLVGDQPAAIAERLAADYADLPHGEETADAIIRALEAPRSGEPAIVEILGGGWTADEALSIALYAVLSSESFEEGATIAVRHGGDSDSTGAIAGSLLGMLYPDEVLAHRWRDQIECQDLIEGLLARSTKTVEDSQLHFPPFA